jgi:hypothetical protein
MKASALAYGGILLILIISSITIVYIIGGVEPVSRSVITTEGKLLYFGNEVNIFIKMFDQSIEFISQRAAYDLGENGGFKDEVFWDTSYPKMDDLKKSLEARIGDNLPSSNIKDVLEVDWGEGAVNVLKYNEDPCVSSQCFFVDGYKHMTLYDETTMSKSSLNPHEFNMEISSNYFKLLNAGLAITSDSNFYNSLDDYVALLNALYTAKANGDSRFKDLDFEATSSGDVVYITIVEECYPRSQDTYCLAPLKNGETGIKDSSGSMIPYDYYKLKLKYQKAQTGHTTPTFDFSLMDYPQKGTTYGNEILKSLVTIVNLGTERDSVSLSVDSISPSASTIKVDLNTNPIVPPDESSLMTITVGPSTPAGTYVITIKGTARGITRTASYTLEILPTTPKTISLTTNPVNINIGGTSTVTASTSTGASGVSISCSVTSGSGSISSSPCTTVSGGSCTVTYNAPSSATTATVTCSASGWSSGSTTITVSSISRSITVSTNQPSINIGQTSTITATTNPSTSGVSITCSVTSGLGTVGSCSGTGGSCTATYTAPSTATAATVTCSASGWNSGSATINVGSKDTTPPSAINDLATSDPRTHSIKLTWTAPGDDGNSGTASQYDIRYYPLMINSEERWNLATPVTGEPAPKPAGSTESFTVTGLWSSTMYHFAIKTADEVPNWSDLSNTPFGTTLSESGTCTEDCNDPDGNDILNGQIDSPNYARYTFADCSTSCQFDYCSDVHTLGEKYCSGIDNAIHTRSKDCNDYDGWWCLDDLATGDETAEYRDHSCSSGFISICKGNPTVAATSAGTCTYTVTQTTECKKEAVDTDAKDYLNKGTCTNYKGCNYVLSGATTPCAEPAIYEDRCRSGTLTDLYEYFVATSSTGTEYCDMETIDCSVKYGTGYICNDGKCQKPICAGSVLVGFNPDPVYSRASMSFTSFGLSECSGKRINYRSGSCSGSIVASCTSGDTGCEVSWTAPSTVGSYTYYATIDKNGDGDASDTGECGSGTLIVNTPFSCPSSSTKLQCSCQVTLPINSIGYTDYCSSCDAPKYGSTLSRSGWPMKIGHNRISPGEINRGFEEFGTSSVPDGSTITGAVLSYYGQTYATDDIIRGMTYRPSSYVSTSPSTVYTDAGDGTVYYNTAGFPAEGSNILKFDGTIYSDIQNSLATNWFAIGLQSKDESTSGVSTIYAGEAGVSPSSPTLYVNFSSNPTSLPTSPSWWNCNWKYRKEILINDNSGKDLTNYQVKVTVTPTASMRSDLGDVRFTDYSGNELQYYFEATSWDKNFYVNVPNIQACGVAKIYMYYGNPSAMSKSTSSVFDFYEGFSGSSLDMNVWTPLSGSTFTIGGVGLEITKGVVSLANPLPFDLRNDYLLESKIYYQSVPTSGTSYNGGSLTASTSQFGTASGSIVRFYKRGCSGVCQPFCVGYLQSSACQDSTCSSNSLHFCGFGCARGVPIGDDCSGTWGWVLSEGISSGGVDFYNASVLGGPMYYMYTIQRSLTNEIRYITLGDIDGQASTANPETDFVYVRVRKYTRPEPTDVMYAEESGPTC